MSGISPRPSPIRRALSGPDWMWTMFILALLISILLPSLSRARTLAKRAVCASNLRGFGMAMHVYANDHKGIFPLHYYEAEKEPTGTPPSHGIRWVGMMGSSPGLKITQATSPQVSPKAGHPSRSMFLLITQGLLTPKQFNCPDSQDREDALHNQESDRAIAARPGVDRFDFTGYRSLSYGYQMPFGPAAVPTWNLDARMVVNADKGPYYEAGEPGLDGTMHDRRSTAQPPESESPEELLGWAPERWRPFNTRNHGREGQNVVFVDGHAEFLKNPLIGVMNDNIYTLTNTHSRIASLTGIAIDVNQTFGPMIDTDSIIVP